MWFLAVAKQKTSICEFEIIFDPLKPLAHNKTIKTRGVGWWWITRRKKVFLADAGFEKTEKGKENFSFLALKLFMDNKAH